MTRGRLPQKGLDVAVPIARERGLVMEFRQTAENLCEFVIVGNGCVAFVRVRKARRLHGAVEDIAAEFSGAIVPARTIPSGGPVSRELWLYSRHCVLRFFRITDAGIIAIDRSGMPISTVADGSPGKDEPGIPAERTGPDAPAEPSGPAAPADPEELNEPAAPAIMAEPGDRPVPPTPSGQAILAERGELSDVMMPAEAAGPADLVNPAGQAVLADPEEPPGPVQPVKPGGTGLPARTVIDGEADLPPVKESGGGSS